MHTILNLVNRAFNRKELITVERGVDAVDKQARITISNKNNSRLYALIIGINEYPKLKPLAGAVADAAAMEEFLSVDLKVPPDHINKLCESRATRDAIIKAFRQLRDDPRIRRGDPILIFYAGHGGLGKASPEWRKRYGYDDIQVIFPYDYDLPLPGSQGFVNCIPDRIVATLLNELAAVKGNNITIIFDSCHSASANRGENTDEAVPGRIARDAEVQINLPDGIDSDIVPIPPTEPLDRHSNRSEESRHADTPLYSNQASHVQFAACGSQEKAWEEDGRGVFTAALLKCIRANGVDKISYSELMASLPLLPKQSPHCYGIHKSRILFDSQVPSSKVTFVPVKSELNALVLQAGVASGVTLGSVWELHTKPTENSKSLGRFQAQPPQVSSTILGPVNGVQTPALGSLKQLTTDRLYARQVRSGTGQELRVYFSPEAKRLIFPTESNTNATRPVPIKHYEVGYVVHPARDSADLVVELYQQSASRPHESETEPEVEYSLCDLQTKKYGVATLKKRTRAHIDEVERILFAAARWHWHLRRTNASARSASTMSLELVKLGARYGDYMVPTDGPLDNLNKTGIVDLKAREEDQYGIRLLSQASVAVYVRVLYFDTSDFSVVGMFGHTQANGRADPDIPAHGRLMIGDDADGGAPLSFRLDSDEVLDVGYIKVFWSTDPFELDAMSQSSAFDSPEHDGESSRKVQVRERKPAKEWGTVLVTLVQRAPE